MSSAPVMGWATGCMAAPTSVVARWERDGAAYTLTSSATPATWAVRSIATRARSLFVLIVLSLLSRRSSLDAAKLAYPACGENMDYDLVRRLRRLHFDHRKRFADGGGQAHRFHALHTVTVSN